MLMADCFSDQERKFWRRRLRRQELGEFAAQAGNIVFYRLSTGPEGKSLRPGGKGRQFLGLGIRWSRSVFFLGMRQKLIEYGANSEYSAGVPVVQDFGLEQPHMSRSKSVLSLERISSIGTGRATPGYLEEVEAGCLMRAAGQNCRGYSSSNRVRDPR